MPMRMATFTGQAMSEKMGKRKTGKRGRGE